MLSIIVIALIVAVGSGLLVLLSRALLARAARGPRTGSAEQRPAPEQPRGPATPEMLVYLFAHRFVREMSPAKAVRHRSRYVAPLTGQEVDPQDAAEKMLFAALSQLYVAGHVDFEVRESDVTLMPPFPHKGWTLLARKLDEFPRGPLNDKLAAAFLSHGSRARKLDDNDTAVPLMDLTETTLSGLRAEMSFWKRAGVYGDLRAFVETHLVERGYMLPPTKETWLDALRYKPVEPNRPLIERLEAAADELHAKLREFRDAHGSRPEAGEDQEHAIPEVNAAIVEASADPERLPLCDCLRASISEALTVIRQQEPSEQVGI